MAANVFGQALFQEAEDLLEKWKHPDPYHAPTAPGGEFRIFGSGGDMFGGC